MVSLNGVERALIVAGMHGLSAVFIGDDKLIILRPRMPRLADFQTALIAFNGNMLFQG